MMTHEGGYSPTYVPLCGVSVLSEMSGVDVDVIGELLAGFDTMPEHTMNSVQKQAVDSAAAAAGLT